MPEAAIIQLCVTVGGIFAAMFVTIRFSIAQKNKNDQAFFDFIKDMESKQLEYYESKNGHLERISAKFAKAIDKNTKVLQNVADKFKNVFTKK